MKAFIFDLDGVIVSTDSLHYRAWKSLADSEGIYFDEKINHRLRGVSRMESLEIILERATRSYTQEEKVVMAERKNGIYRELLQVLTPEDRLEGVTETLAALREKGYKLAIGSSSKNTPIILGKIGYSGYFDAISDGNNIKNSKPDPEVFLKAAEFFFKNSTISWIWRRARISARLTAKGSVGSSFTTRVVLKCNTPSPIPVNVRISSRGFWISPRACASL